MNSVLSLNSIEEKQRNRYWLLQQIYERAEGSEGKMVLFESVPQEFVKKDFYPTLTYLISEGLVAQVAVGVGGPLVRITHKGVLEMEASISNPQQSTEHFMPQIIQNFNAPVGSVQTGNQNTANVAQNIGAEVTDITALLKKLRHHIVDDTPEQQQEGLELLEGLEAEAQSPNQSKSRIKLYLKEVGAFVKDTGKDILVSIGTELLKDQMGLPK